jgi:TolB-like protein/Flp pilus assembly protein TadD
MWLGGQLMALLRQTNGSPDRMPDAGRWRFTDSFFVSYRNLDFCAPLIMLRSPIRFMPAGAAELLYLFNDLALDTDRRELRRAQNLVAIAPQVFDLLEYLIRNRERVVSKDDLLGSIWHGRIVSDSALNTRINAARCAIDDTGEEQCLIRTLPRKGLRFIGAVREEYRPATRESGSPCPAEHPCPALTHPDRPSIAVLPFVNMTGEPEQECLADGATEEVITALSRCSRLFVVARNSSFAYRGKAVDVREVGRELGVRYVLEGSVRRGGDRVRFTGRLIDATSGGHIWADWFEGNVGNVLDLHDRFAERVVAAIEPRLQLAEIERLKRKPPSNLDPYDLLLRAQQYEYELRVDSHAAALRHLDQALVVDPSYAPAMALAAFCHAERRVQGWMQEPEVEAREALRLASRAVELGKDDANVFWMAGYAVLRLQMDAVRARELVRHSLDINPNSAIVTAIAGELETLSGNSAKAVELISRAEHLSPRDPRDWFIGLKTAWIHFVDGQFDQTISAAKKVLHQNPRSSYALRFLAASLAKQGRQDHAAAAMREVRNIEPQLTATRLRPRLMFIEEKVWKDYSAALRLAGLPE